ncbi:hypothetical protein ACFW9M_26980 [Streptomyces lydicus]|uniref:hypothetical protein n=1 Tax=Streptomyces lydicus TaxID=47763 RepID=UPI0036B83CB6
MPWLSRTRLRTAGAVLAAALVGGALTENATHATGIDHLIQIADALGVPLAALVDS